jgi:hypothetical protein
MEKNMTRKITAILAAAVVLGSFGVASAGTNNHRSIFRIQEANICARVKELLSSS